MSVARTGVRGCMAALLLSVSLAHAADLQDVPPSKPLPSWAGLYAGSFVGLGFSSFTSSQSASKTASFLGMTGGALLGYNLQSGSLVYGVETDLGLNQIRGDRGETINLVATHDDTLYASHLRGSFGYDLGALHPFIAGGVAMSETYISQIPPTAYYGTVHRQLGWTAGAGVDWKVNAPLLGPLILRVEYVYDGLPNRTFDVGSAGAPDPVRTRTGTSYLRAALIFVPGDIGRPWQGLTSTTVDWAGPYAGVIGGWSNARPSTTAGALHTHLSADGGLAGPYIGNNFTYGPWVFGLEGAVELADVTGTGALPGAASVSYRGNVELDTRARIGYAFGRFLPFFAAGAIFDRAVERDMLTQSEWGRVASDAWTVGAGLEYRLADSWSMRGEYLYGAGFIKTLVALNGCICEQTQNSQKIRFGLAYKFQ